MVANSIDGANFAALLDSNMKWLISDGFEKAKASEGSIWLCDSRQENLIVAFNTGLNTSREIEHFSQPLTAGIVSMAFSNEQSFLENDVFKNSRHDTTLDSKLNVKTRAMIVTPFYFLGACRGVMTCVQFEEIPPSRSLGFNEGDMGTLRQTAAVLGKLVDARILRTVVGLG